MRDQRFEWDDRKAAANLKKHHVSFDEARDVFDDDAAIEREDADPDEDRYIRIGLSNGQLLFVVYTEREGRDGLMRTRIISAREATKHEEGLYHSS